VNQIMPTLTRAIDGFYLAKGGEGRSEDTLHDYRTTMKRFANFIGPEVSLNKITTSNINEFFKYLDNFTFIPGHRSSDQTRSRKLSPKTIRNYQVCLSSFWNWVASEYEIPIPRVPKRTAKDTPVMPLSPTEIDRLLKACEYSDVQPTNREAFHSRRRTSLRDRAIIMMLYDTGVRSSELVGMRFSDVDENKAQIRVTGKGSKQRLVHYGKYVARLLWKYHSARFPDSKPSPDDYLFVDDEGMRPMNRGSVLQMIVRIGKKAGIPNVHPHRFRHAFAVEYLRNGGNVLALQEELGHTTLKMVQRYVQLASVDLEDAHRKASPGDAMLRR
jgi:integrase/recombinase XerD